MVTETLSMCRVKLSKALAACEILQVLPRAMAGSSALSTASLHCFWPGRVKVTTSEGQLYFRQVIRLGHCPVMVFG